MAVSVANQNKWNHNGLALPYNSSKAFFAHIQKSWIFLPNHAFGKLQKDPKRVKKLNYRW